MNGMTPEQTKLVTDNLRFAHYMARRFLASGIEYDDLVSTAYIGLIKAAQRYDGRAKYSTYASVVIRNEILMELRRQKKNVATLPLNAPIAIRTHDSDDIEYLDLIADSDPPVEHELEVECDRAAVHEAVAGLGDFGRTIITQLYGLDGGEPQRQIDAARSLGLTQSYVSRVRKKAFAALRTRLDAQVI